MRTLLRHTPTGQYFQSLDKWTKSSRKAHDFKHIALAVKFVHKTRFPDMELVLTRQK